MVELPKCYPIPTVVADINIRSFDLTDLLILKFLNFLLKLSYLSYHHTKSGVIYRYVYDRLEQHDTEYIGESARTFGERINEHFRTPSPIYDHNNITGHQTCVDNFSIMGRDSHYLATTIIEAI